MILGMGPQGHNQAPPGGLLLLFTLFLGLSFIYTLPAFISASRNSPNFLAILIINIIFGWTVVGYVAMLIWACVDNIQPNRSNQAD
jgi:hypothetical protein